MTRVSIQEDDTQDESDKGMENAYKGDDDRSAVGWSCGRYLRGHERGGSRKKYEEQQQSVKRSVSANAVKPGPCGVNVHYCETDQLYPKL